MTLLDVPEDPAASAAAAAAADPAVLASALETVVNDIESAGEKVSRREFAQLFDALGARGYALAARSDASGAAGDRLVTADELRVLLAQIRKG